LAPQPSRPSLLELRSSKTPLPNSQHQPQPIASGASVGEQIRPKAAQAQQQKAHKLAVQQSKPDLPFHPGRGISR